MAGDCITPDAASQIAAKDTNRIVGKIAEVLVRKSPWMDILDGGTIGNESDVVRSVVQEQAVMGQSLTAPAFTADTAICGTNGNKAEVGSTEYTYQLESMRGRGPRVCVKTTRTAFKDSYIRAQQALEKGILKIMNADIRANLYTKSGVKFVCRNDKTFSQLVTGDAQAINTLFVNLLPNAAISFTALYRMGQFLREDLLVEPFETDATTMFKYIGSLESIERFRQELDVREDLRAFVTGKFPIGDKSLNSYAFQGPWRNFGFAIDNQPLRFDEVDRSGQPILIEPEISAAATTGVAARVNPAWLAAKYEIGFLAGAQSFERLVPARYVGEGSFKFAPQLHMGELEWTYFRDNDCNQFGDFGQHIYQISRAYRPMRPHAIVPIAYQRCNYDLGLSACATSVSGL